MAPRKKKTQPQEQVSKAPTKAVAKPKPKPQPKAAKVAPKVQSKAATKAPSASKGATGAGVQRQSRRVAQQPAENDGLKFGRRSRQVVSPPLVSSKPKQKAPKQESSTNARQQEAGSASLDIEGEGSAEPEQQSPQPGPEADSDAGGDRQAIQEPEEGAVVNATFDNDAQVHGAAENAAAESTRTIDRLPQGLVPFMKELEEHLAFKRKLQTKIARATPQYQRDRARMDDLTRRLFPEVENSQRRLEIFVPVRDNAEHQEVAKALTKSHSRLYFLQQRGKVHEQQRPESREGLEEALLDNLGQLMPARQLPDHHSLSTTPGDRGGLEGNQLQASGSGSMNIALDDDHGGHASSVLRRENLVFQGSDDSAFLKARQSLKRLRSQSRFDFQHAEANYRDLRALYNSRKDEYEGMVEERRTNDTLLTFDRKWKLEYENVVSAFELAKGRYEKAASMARRVSCSTSDLQTSKFASVDASSYLSALKDHCKAKTDMNRIARWQMEMSDGTPPSHPSTPSIVASPPAGEVKFAEADHNEKAAGRAADRLKQWDDKRYETWQEMTGNDRSEWFANRGSEDRFGVAGAMLLPRSHGGSTHISYSEDSRAPWHGHDPALPKKRKFCSIL